MRRAVMGQDKRKSKRELFAELTEGMAALAESRQGKRTLRTHAVEFKPAPTVTPGELVRVRESLNLSRALFAVYLRTNVGTVENWEQGRAKPNAQAALLINLLKRFPDTVERLAAVESVAVGRREGVLTRHGKRVARMISEKRRNRTRAAAITRIRVLARKLDIRDVEVRELIEEDRR